MLVCDDGQTLKEPVMMVMLAVKCHAPHMAAGEDTFLACDLRAREVDGFLDIFDAHIGRGLAALARIELVGFHARG